METVSQESNRKRELDMKIKMLEQEKINLQKDIARIKDMLTTAALEKKANMLEKEVATLKSVKVKLEQQIPNNPPLKPQSQKPTQNRMVEKESLVRYGSWSKLPLT